MRMSGGELKLMKHVKFVTFKGIVHQFWIYKVFFVSQQKKWFLWKVHLDKTTLTRNNWEKWCSKYCYVYYIYNTDWLWAPYFLNYFNSELFYRDGPIIKNVSFVETQKNGTYSKLVNNPFNPLMLPFSYSSFT